MNLILSAGVLLIAAQTPEGALPEAARQERARQEETVSRRTYTNESFGPRILPVDGTSAEDDAGAPADATDPAQRSQAEWARLFDAAIERIEQSRARLGAANARAGELSERVRALERREAAGNATDTFQANRRGVEVEEADAETRRPLSPLEARLQDMVEETARARTALARANRALAELREEFRASSAPRAWGR